jgi:hypothetical protein
VAYNYHEIKLQKGTSGEGEKSIFEAQNQLWKYLTYHSKATRESWEKDRSLRHVYFFFPAIVLDGQLFEASGPSERVRLHERNHIILSFSRRSKTLGEDRSFMIDIVTKRYFRKYVDLIKRDINVIRDEFKENKEYLMYEADSIVETLP